MKKIYYLLFAMLPLAAWAGEVKVTKPVLTLENDTLTLVLRLYSGIVCGKELQDLAACCRHR